MYGDNRESAAPAIWAKAKPRDRTQVGTSSVENNRTDPKHTDIPNLAITFKDTKKTVLGFCHIDKTIPLPAVNNPVNSIAPTEDALRPISFWMPAWRDPAGGSVKANIENVMKGDMPWPSTFRDIVLKQTNVIILRKATPVNIIVRSEVCSFQLTIQSAFWSLSCASVASWTCRLYATDLHQYFDFSRNDSESPQYRFCSSRADWIWPHAAAAESPHRYRSVWSATGHSPEQGSRRMWPGAAEVKWNTRKFSSAQREQPAMRSKPCQVRKTRL